MIDQEKDLHREINRHLSNQGIAVGTCRMDRPSTMPKGWPDMTFSYQGYFVGWELKTAKGKLSSEQVQYAESITSPPGNGQWRVIRSLQEAKDHLAELDIKRKKEIQSR